LRLVDAALGAVELPHRHHAAVGLLVLLDRRVAIAQHRRVLAALDDVVRVGRDERSAVVADRQRVLDDLLGLPVAQVDHADAGVGLVADEQELPS
jgi:hypothetical protein